MTLSELRAELQDALRDLAPGAVRGILAIPTGYALVQRVEAAPARRCAATLVANIEGNQFTPEQLGDLVQATLRR